MNEAESGPVTLSVNRQNTFEPPQELTRWRHEAPIRRMTYADGHLGWLVTSHSAVRSVLADNRFSTRPDLQHPALPYLIRQRQLPLPAGFFLRMDPPDHTRYRRLLTGQFTVRRMKQLEPGIEKIVAERLDEMERRGPSLDLVESFALPIPSLVICELLGVPYADHDRFQGDSAVIVSREETMERKQAAVADLLAYLHDLVRRKRAEPADDLLSGLAEGGELTDEELTGVALLLLVAGHETTANMIALGVFALLSNPPQLAALRDDPSLAASTVEELLRYLSIVDFTVRAALEDVELEGQTIRAGETVTVSIPAANHDPERFDGPGALDVTRNATGHLSFGHGIHQCLGQQLARNEMRLAIPALLERLPGLRLAVPPEEVPMRSDMAIYGVHRLPVTW
ncbi:cytochrome P450 [Streptosporangium carneum]|uniref:Cytochrome P450 n=1 Tax=Streptosporangium carneum TaxID=47481 RepID=A0A9W6HXF6_9ACTN|nr:cytochrome P450 [Streptosporangium carneum]GLK07536.1 cytochrome P450 [Streptosporangium carneum]